MLKVSQSGRVAWTIYQMDLSSLCPLLNPNAFHPYTTHDTKSHLGNMKGKVRLPPRIRTP